MYGALTEPLVDLQFFLHKSGVRLLLVEHESLTSRLYLSAIHQLMREYQNIMSRYAPNADKMIAPVAAKPVGCNNTLKSVSSISVWVIVE